MNKNDLLKKFKDEPELGKLKNLHTDLIINGCKLSEKMFDSRGNNKDGGWGINETRGGEPYDPPEGWIRYGLNVVGKYDNGNDDWLAYDNRKGEWCIAYHIKIMMIADTRAKKLEKGFIVPQIQM